MSQQREGLSLGRDQLIVLVSLAGLALLSWIYIADLAGRMPGVTTGAAAMAKMNMAGMNMGDMAPASAAPSPYDPALFGLTALMWFVMMLGMMLPSAAPMILLYAQVQRKRSGASPLVRTAVFVSGYLLAWGGFSVAAAALQQVLSQAALVTPGLVLASTRIAGAVLIAAGLYELTPFKQACLAHCRGAAAFVASHWRPGAAGAVRMGAIHGLYCMGCCWALMLLLFVGGVMNLLWIAALAALVLVQKLLPGGRAITWLTAGSLVVAGLAVISGNLDPRHFSDLTRLIR
jgi:predicted metal-binding membrane protein